MKNLIKIALLGTGLILAMWSTVLGYGKQKAVYHINGDNHQQNRDALVNIQNHINAVGAENLDIRVVMHGNGLAVLMYPDEVECTKMKRGNANEEMQTRITGLKNQGVRFHVCANTLKDAKSIWKKISMMPLRMMWFPVGLLNSPTCRFRVIPISSPDSAVERQLSALLAAHRAAFSDCLLYCFLKSYLWKSHNSTDRVIGEMSVVINIALLARATLTW